MQTVQHVEGESSPVDLIPHATVPNATGRRIEFDYLRASVIVLVLWHHAILAYHTFAYLNPEYPTDTFSPVVDSQRWAVFDMMAAFNDTFFMSLMFFVSGLFVWRSLTRKGAKAYLKDRFRRLGIPFIIGVSILMPLAYFPAQLEVNLVFGGSAGFGDLWMWLFRNGFPSPGPMWFLWLLFVFDYVLVLYFQTANPSVTVPDSKITRLFNRPLALFGVLLGVSTAVYVPVVFIFGPETWIGVGPFVAQAGRILVYLVYFLAGAALGAYGLDRGLLRSDGPLARRWWGWLIAGLTLFLIANALVPVGTVRPIISELAFVVPCAVLVFATVGLFLRFGRRRIRILDSLAENSFGIYIVHYVFVTWLQYGLVSADLPALSKAVLVFSGTLMLSWGVIATIRRIPVVARVI